VTVPDLSNTRWRKSSRSDSSGGAFVELGDVWRTSSHSSDIGGDCVELAGCPHDVAVRDSKDPDGPRLVFGSVAFGVFARRVKAGELDLP